MALALAAFTHTPAIAQSELSDRTFTDVETGRFGLIPLSFRVVSHRMQVFWNTP